MGRLLLSGLPAVTVADASGCDTRYIEEDEVYSMGRPRTAFTHTVTKLVRGTEIKYRGPSEKLSGPLLEDTTLDIMNGNKI